MTGTFERLAGRLGRAVALASLAVGAAGVLATPALAQPLWRITMTHANPYGAQASQCPTKKVEPSAPCGINPLTEAEGEEGAGGDGETFARESGSNTYKTKVVNVGTSATTPEEEVIVVDHLPKGFVLGEQEATSSEGWSAPGGQGRCKVLPGAVGVECARKDELAPGEAYPEITLHVHVTAEAENPSTNVAEVKLFNAAATKEEEGELNKTATVKGLSAGTTKLLTAQTQITGTGIPANTFVKEVKETEIVLTQAATTEGRSNLTFTGLLEGGGLPSETTKEDDRTTVTNAVPFDFVAWTVNVDDSLGNPFNQAGGHPFSVTNELVSTYTTSSGGELIPAGGAAKGEQVELPPGFVGNPLATPRCQGRALVIGRCPGDTAVGYLVVATSGAGRIVAGKPVIYPALTREYLRVWSSLIYNMEPAPGFPAQFGFVIQGLAYVLDAKLRSDGNYGVTVGDTAIAEKLLASRVTFCEYGAKVETLETTLKYSCDPAGLNTTPFNANPTQCPSSPAEKEAARWTLVADSWYRPELYVSKAAYPNMDTEGVTGCNLLDFNPEMRFTPRTSAEGGTTQADEPTGTSFALKLPQETSVNATPQLKTLVMKLPAGLTPSASAADGLEACSNSQFGLGTEFGPGSPHTEPAKPASCPLASQIGTFEVFTPLLSGAPRITGIPEAGQSLTCAEGNWSGRPKVRFTWLRDGEQISGASTEIPGAESAQYTVAPETDEGHAIQCQVSATNTGGRSVAVSQDADVPGRFHGEVHPGVRIVRGVTSFRGVAVGSELFATGLAPDTTVVSVDEGRKELEMSSPAGIATVGATISAIPVLPSPPESIAAPSGIASVGNPLTCASGGWRGRPKFKFTWLRDGTEIPGASTQVPGAESAQYTLTSADEGHVIQCQVRGESESGATIADSAAVVVSPVPSSPPPLPGAALQGQVYQGQPECSPCTEEHEDAAQGRVFRLFLQAEDPSVGEREENGVKVPGLIIKLQGSAYVNEATGQLETRFEEQPRQPFELLEVKLKGGPRAVLANPQSCGPAVTSADLTPWSAPGTPDGVLKPEYSVDSDGAGGACPAAWPFNPSFNAGTTGPAALAAGAFTHFSLTFGREDREQDLSGVEVHLPRGLVGKIAAVKQCGEAEVHAAERNEGECPAESQIGTATAGAGPGPHPFFQKGKVYLTGPYKGAPFGLAVVTPAIAGPFNLGNVVVRSAIAVDPGTAAVTATSDPLPQLKDGVLLRLRKVRVEVNNPEFMLNPTNCAQQQVSAKLISAQGASAQVSSAFDVGGCASLPFSPELTAEAGAHGSKANGTSFIVKVKARPGDANIAKTYLQLPIALPSRLDTIQKACPAEVFEANPAACGEGSNIGRGIAHTPLLKSPLAGPAYLVSHAAGAFPDVEFVLQGEGITLILDGKTDIKKGITYSRFETVPDAPVSSFEAVLPAGPHSALTTYLPGAEQYNLCSTTLLMPTELIGQNGAAIRTTTHIALAGCAPSVAITKARVTGNTLLVTFKTGAAGAVWLSGYGLRATHKDLTAGTHQLRVPFTKLGVSRHKHHKRTSVRVKLVVGKQAVTKAMTVRL